jgi:predicted RNA-binding protein with EMAP domain
LNADLLHVTAIALGQSNLAVVNGKRVTEGDSFVVVTSDGPAAVRVAKIEEGVVHFAYGTEKIEAKLLTETVAQKAPP